MLTLQQSWMRNMAYLSEYGLTGLEGHLNRVSQGTERLCLHLGFSMEQAETVGIASLTHDIGKVAVARELWLKPASYSEQERKYVQMHVERGYDMLCRMADHGMRAWLGSELMDAAIEICRYHHENWNGTGYPGRLQGNRIPLSARIVKIIDVTDALMQKRPYKEAWAMAEVEQELRRKSGVDFDPRLLDIWLGEGGISWFGSCFSPSSQQGSVLSGTISSPETG